MTDAVGFFHADNHESLLLIDIKIIWWVWSSIPKVPKKASLQYLFNIPKIVRDEVDFFDADKHQSFRISILWASKFSTIWQAWLWKREGHGDGNDQAFLKYSK